MKCMPGSRKFVRVGPTLTFFLLFFFFSLWGGERIKMQLKAGHHQPASKMPLKWRFAGVPIMANH